MGSCDSASAKAAPDNPSPTATAAVKVAKRISQTPLCVFVSFVRFPKVSLESTTFEIKFQQLATFCNIVFCFQAL
jgi:hypothetical protein